MSDEVDRAAEVLATGSGRDVPLPVDHWHAKALADAGLLATEQRYREVAARAWGRGYEYACSDHRAYSSCGQPGAHHHDKINPYRIAGGE